MNITFDSNVWERVVNEEDHHLVNIKNKIRIGEIQAYICEIALSLLNFGQFVCVSSSVFKYLCIFL